ncbi:MAG TPA: hypothetical protein VF719_09940, partial [Abditibacteriaceae bacterium]
MNITNRSKVFSAGVLGLGAVLAFGQLGFAQPAPDAAGMAQNVEKWERPNRGARRAGGQRGKNQQFDKLNLSATQKTQLQAVLKESAEQRKAVRGDANLSAKQKRERSKELRAGTQERIRAILTPDQQAQLRGLQAERKAERREGEKAGKAEAGKGRRNERGEGHRGNALRGVVKGLGLTDAQKAQIQPILKEAAAQMKAVRSDANLSPEQKRTRTQELRAEVLNKVSPLLTAEQRAKLVELQNQQRADRGERRGGGRRGGGRRGG